LLLLTVERVIVSAFPLLKMPPPGAPLPTVLPVIVEPVIVASSLAQDYPGPIQLLMADILMPKMGGIELAEQLTALRPALKVLYTSGYNDGASSLQRVAGSRYLQKPYAMKELAHMVRDLLDDASASKSLAT
jgi:DNA-binding NtrC family response regulator